MEEAQTINQYQEEAGDAETAEEENEESRKKIGLPLAIFVMEIIILAAAFEDLTSLTGVGIIMSEAINAVVTFGVEAWLFLIGARGMRQLGTFVIGSIADAATGNLFAIIVEPLVMALTIYFVNHPKAAQLTQLAKGKVEAGKENEESEIGEKK